MQMSNTLPRICTTGDEVMAHSFERKAVVTGPGEIKRIKRATNRRERREARRDLDPRNW